MKLYIYDIRNTDRPSFFTGTHRGVFVDSTGSIRDILEVSFSAKDWLYALNNRAESIGETSEELIIEGTEYPKSGRAYLKNINTALEQA